MGQKAASQLGPAILEASQGWIFSRWCRVFYVAWTEEDWLSYFREDLVLAMRIGGELVCAGQPPQACSQPSHLSPPRVDLSCHSTRFQGGHKNWRVRTCHAICSLALQPGEVMGPIQCPSLRLKAVSWKVATCSSN